MEMLVAAHMARRAYTGGGLMARWYMRGWDQARKARLAQQAVRVYRMTAREYMAFVLDALARRTAGESTPDPNPTGQNRAKTGTPRLLVGGEGREAA
jgi:hypothetical protein